MTWNLSVEIPQATNKARPDVKASELVKYWKCYLPIESCGLTFYWCPLLGISLIEGMWYGITLGEKMMGQKRVRAFTP